jgi:hypothetical protein
MNVLSSLGFSDIYVAHPGTGTILDLDEIILVDLAGTDDDLWEDPSADDLNDCRMEAMNLKWDPAFGVTVVSA